MKYISGGNVITSNQKSFRFSNYPYQHFYECCPKHLSQCSSNLFVCFLPARSYSHVHHCTFLLARTFLCMCESTLRARQQRIRRSKLKHLSHVASISFGCEWWRPTIWYFFAAHTQQQTNLQRAKRSCAHIVWKRECKCVSCARHASQVHTRQLPKRNFSCIVFGGIFGVSYRGERRYFAREPKGFFESPFIKMRSQTGSTLPLRQCAPLEPLDKHIRQRGKTFWPAANHQTTTDWLNACI